MKCNKCNFCVKEDMAQIPYIEHKRRMFKAYQREIKLRRWLIGTNAMWIVGLVVWLVTR